MSEYRAHALRADWLNAWLAAIGVTVLCDGLKLRWSNDPRPAAIFSLPEGDVIERIAGALPMMEELEQLVIAREHHDAQLEMTRNFGLDVYVERSRVARRSSDDSLSSSVTDLVVLDGNLPHSPFDVSVPKGLTLHDRLLSCRTAIADDPVADVAASLSVGQRTGQNGLGFDIRRIATGVQADGAKRSDPVVEVLAFHGLLMFPVRGNGRASTVARGWRDRATRAGAFSWPVWDDPLDRWAIDAELDRFHRSAEAAAFETVPYQPLARADVTRGYGSSRVR